MMSEVRTGYKNGRSSVSRGMGVHFAVEYANCRLVWRHTHEQKQHDVTEELLESLLSNYQKPEDLLGDSSLLKQLTKRLVEKALEVEIAEHLGHDRLEPIQKDEGNARNGKSKKTLKGEFGELPIDIPIDRQGTFEPKLIPKQSAVLRAFGLRQLITG